MCTRAANGYLKRRYVDIGDHVHQGQLLAIIDAPDLDQQVDQARAALRQAQSQLAQQQSQLDLARVTWDRWKVLVAKGVFSRQDGDQRETDYNAQLSNVAAAQRNVQSFEANLGRVIASAAVRARHRPFRRRDHGTQCGCGCADLCAGFGGVGYFYSSPASSGSPTQSGSTNTSGTTGNVNTSATPSTGGAQGGALFSIAQVNKLRILVSVPEGYSQLSTLVSRLRFIFSRSRSETFYGKVTRTAGSIDLNSRTLLTEVQVDNKDGRLLSGMYVVVNFVDMHGVPGITIPGDAVVVRADKNQVALIRNGMVHMQPIDIGRDFGPSVEVLNGLKPGDVLVTAVTDEVKEGVKVRSELWQESWRRVRALQRDRNLTSHQVVRAVRKPEAGRLCNVWAAQQRKAEDQKNGGEQ